MEYNIYLHTLLTAEVCTQTLHGYVQLKKVRNSGFKKIDEWIRVANKKNAAIEQKTTMLSYKYLG